MLQRLLKSKSEWHNSRILFQLTISSMCRSYAQGKVPWKYTASKNRNSGPCPEMVTHGLCGSRCDPKNSLSIARRKFHATELLPGITIGCGKHFLCLMIGDILVIRSSKFQGKFVSSLVCFRKMVI